MRALIQHILSKKWYLLVLFLILAFLRLYRIEQFVTFLGDQGRDAVIIRRIVTFQHFPAIGAPSSIGQIYLGPFYYYYIAPFLLLFNFNPIGLAIGVALTSIVGIILAFFILGKELDKKTALLFLLFSVFSYPLIELARFSWNPNLLPVFSFFTLYFFYKQLTNRKLWWAIAFGAFLSFSIQLHHLASFLVIPIAIVFLLHLKDVKGKWISNIVNLVASVFSFIVCSSPLIVFDLRHQFLNSRNFINLLTNKGVVGKSSYFVRFLDTNQGFFQHLLQVTLNTYLALGILIAVIIASIIVLKKNKVNTLVLLHALNVIGFIAAFSLLESSRHLHYYGTIYLSFFLVIAYLLHFIIQKNKIALIGISVLFIGFVGLNARSYHFLTEHGSNQIEKARKIAASFEGRISSDKFQTVPVPDTTTDGHIRYFLELDGHTPLPETSLEQPDELFAICDKPDCVVIGSPQWQIAAFTNKKIDQKWTAENVTIYKLIHGSAQ